MRAQNGLRNIIAATGRDRSRPIERAEHFATRQIEHDAVVLWTIVLRSSTRREQTRQVVGGRERKREREKHMDRKGGTREYSKEVLKKNPLIILSVNRASPADDIAVENAVDNKNFARTRTSSHFIFS